MSKIKSVKAREILASGGAPTLEVEVVTENGFKGEASVSYGASAGSLEATVLLDGDKNRYNGKGMLIARENVNNTLAKLVVGMEVSEQRMIDEKMIDLDGTENKRKLGEHGSDLHLGLSGRTGAPSPASAWLSSNNNPINYIKLGENRKLGEHGSDLQFPRARASEYSAERGQAYLLSSEWVQEFPCRSGRHARIHGPDSNR